MRFKIVNVNGTSIRIDTGIVSFDVTIVKRGEDYRIIKPAGIFFPNNKEYNDFIGAVINAYKNANSMENVIKNEKKGSAEYII